MNAREDEGTVMVDEWAAPDVEEISTRLRPSRMPNGEIVNAAFLAVYESRRDDHTHAGPRPLRGTSCQACRWFELSLFRLDGGGYVLVRQNVTMVDGERTFTRLHRVDTAGELLTISDLGPQSRPMRALLEDAAELDIQVADVVFRTQWETAAP